MLVQETGITTHLPWSIGMCQMGLLSYSPISIADMELKWTIAQSSPTRAKGRARIQWRSMCFALQSQVQTTASHNNRAWKILCQRDTGTKYEAAESLSLAPLPTTPNNTQLIQPEQEARVTVQALCSQKVPGSNPGTSHLKKDLKQQNQKGWHSATWTRVWFCNRQSYITREAFSLPVPIKTASGNAEELLCWISSRSMAPG